MTSDSMGDDGRDVRTSTPRRAKGGGGTGDLSDVLIAGAVWVLIVGSLAAIILSYRSAVDTRALWLSAIAAAAAGWATGLILSPYDRAENNLFKEVGKFLYGLATGYVVAKLDPLVTAALDRAKTDGLPLQVQLIGAVGVTIFLATVVLTFTSRKYWR